MATKGHLGKMRWRAKSVLYLDKGDYPENLQIVFFVLINSVLLNLLCVWILFIYLFILLESG